MTIWEVFQLLLTISEVFLCYWFCSTWMEYGKELNKRKIGIICLLIFISLFTACNRTIAFFSYLIYIQQILSIWIVFLVLGQKRKSMCLLVIFNYHLLVALLDYIGAYIVLCFSPTIFWDDIYFHVGGVRVLIFTITRLFILFLCIAIKRYSNRQKINVEIYRTLLIGVGIVGSIWMWRFQTILLKFKDVNKLGNVVFIFSCFMVLTAVLVGWFNVIYVKKQAQFIQMKNEALEKNYKNLKSLYENNQYIYHDFKNHMTLLKRYIKQKRI